jgi:hypothetical protein
MPWRARYIETTGLAGDGQIFLNSGVNRGFRKEFKGGFKDLKKNTRAVREEFIL